MQMTPQYLAINAAGKYSTSWNAIDAPKQTWFCTSCLSELRLHKSSNGLEACFTHDLMCLTPSKAESCPYIAEERKKHDRLAYLRQIVEQLPLYTNQGKDWRCVLCQQDYHGHKFCVICGSGIYSIEDVSTALPVYSPRPCSRFILTGESDDLETPDILSSLY